VPVRAMYQTEYEVNNYSNWFFSSNRADPISIPPEDRRFNVATYQPNKLILTDDEVKKRIPAELQDFYDYLLHFKMDRNRACSPLKNTARDQIISIGTTSIDDVANAFIRGDFQFFLDHLPTSQAAENAQREIVENYKAVLINQAEMMVDKRRASITRDDLRTLFEYTVGDMPESPNKFTSRMKHHRIHFSTVRMNDVTKQGCKTNWEPSEDYSAILVTLTGVPQATKKGKK